MKRIARFCAALPLLALLFSAAAIGDETCGTPPNTAGNNIRYVSYFLSKPQDAGQCEMKVIDGRIVVSAPASNPAMTCPDLFSWKLFVESVSDGFWKKWAADQETWPGVNCPNGDPKCQNSAPLPLCTAGQSGPSCCDPDSRNNPGYKDPRYPAKQCPFFPGDHLAQYASGMPERLGVAPSKAHTLGFAADPVLRKGLLAVETPGRKIRQSMAEIVFRNKPFFDYVFRNNLYNQEGVIQVFRTNAANIWNGKTSGAPYRLENGTGAIAEIDFPAGAVMIKSDWLSKERALQMGLREDPRYPYIKMSITSPATDNNGTILEPGEHWLVGIHFSSKDTPQWVWTTFEHVNNPGRCDYTGCNDSYGYRTPDKVGAKQAKNYTSPNIKCDNLPLPSWVYDTGKKYEGGAISEGLAGVFAAMGIGTRDNATMIPQPTDRAWLSYRLKGSQVNFTDSMGRHTLLANSVTEGGFITSSSCITCHARAGTASVGTLPPALGVFVNELTDSGYLPSSHGIPNPDWFHRSGQPPNLQILQTDFVWGFLAANCVTQACQPPAAAKALLLAPQPEAAQPLSSVRER